MAEISASLVKELREKTGAGMMDCKKALAETEGHLENAIDYLRKKGLSDAAKKSGRIAAEGQVQSYIHAGGKIGVLVEINCETDFAAGTEDFKEMCRDIALHICANNPLCVSADQIDPALLAREKSIYLDKAKESGKPENVVEKIVEGQMRKFIEASALLTQPFVKNPDITVEKYIAEKGAIIRENLKVRRFVRFMLGEGIEKKQDNFAEEVMKQVQR